MGFLLSLPFFFIRFGLLSLLDKGAVTRAAHFAPLKEKERAAYWIYQVSNAAIFLCLFFLSIKVTPPALFYAGIAVYSAGVLLLTLSIVSFAAPSESGFRQSGLYRLSRHPMYVAYFIFFVGCALLTQSPLLLSFVIIFQISAHFIIRAEERWCLARFGEAYRQYMKKVRRYL